MPKKTKQQADAEFIEKIKSLNLSTASKSGTICPKCHEPLEDHPILKLIAAGGILKRSFRAPEPQENQETAFAA